ncbi:hypothetical protein D3C76_1749990 [compost metagenome]
MREFVRLEHDGAVTEKSRVAPLIGTVGTGNRAALCPIGVQMGWVEGPGDFDITGAPRLDQYGRFWYRGLFVQVNGYAQAVRH